MNLVNCEYDEDSYLLESGHVAPRDVHDVDVVAAARAVLRVEVAAVHEQLQASRLR